MKRYYGVKSIFYNDGSIDAKMVPAIVAEEQPKNIREYYDDCDVYIDWFENYY